MMPRLARRPLSLGATLVLAAALSIPAVPLSADAKAAKDAKVARPAKVKKNQAYVAPDFAAYGVVAIGMAPVSSINHVEADERLFRQAIESNFGTLDHYKFQGSSYFIDAVRKGGVTGALTAIENAAQAGAPADTRLVAAVRGKTSVEAVLFSRLSTWERLVVDPTARGQSFTQVGGDFVLISLKDGAVLWRGSFLEKGDGPYNDPGVGEATERDAGGNSTARQARLEPPGFPEVLEKLTHRAAATLPPAPAPAARTAP